MTEKEKELWLEQWLTVDDVTNEFSISKVAQVQMRYRRKIDYTKAAGRIVYKRRWVLDYLEKSRVKAAQ